MPGPSRACARQTARPGHPAFVASTNKIDGRGKPGHDDGDLDWYSGVNTREAYMPGIKVTDIAYGRLRSPDLDQAEEFLTDFGMVRAARTPTALYMRGSDPQHHIHVTERGE